MDTISKNSLLETLETLPEEVEVDEVIKRVIFLSEIEPGMKSLREGRSIPHEEVVRQFKEKWQLK